MNLEHVVGWSSLMRWFISGKMDWARVGLPWEGPYPVKASPRFPYSFPILAITQALTLCLGDASQNHPCRTNLQGQAEKTSIASGKYATICFTLWNLMELVPFQETTKPCLKEKSGMVFCVLAGKEGCKIFQTYLETVPGIQSRLNCRRALHFRIISHGDFLLNSLK